MFDPFDSEQRAREDAVRETFNRWAVEGKADGMERRHRRLAELMFERVAIPPDGRILDIGCGDGWISRMLSARLSKGAAVGIDLSEEMIRKARGLSGDLDNVLFAPAPAEQIPWAEDYFTHVVSIESAYYWPRPDQVTREIFRVAAYGGSFHVLINFYQENRYSHDWPQAMGLALHLKNAAEWAELFRAGGFEEVKTERIPDDSPIPAYKQGAERELREGLQREGALYVTGKKAGLPPQSHSKPEPFTVLD